MESDGVLRLLWKLVEASREASDIDGGDLQDWLEEAGVLEHVPATAEDCAEEWAREFDIKEGDLIYKLTPLALRARAAATSKTD